MEHKRYFNSYYFNEKTNLDSKRSFSDVVGEFLDVDGDNIDLLCEPNIPSTLNVVWPPGTVAAMEIAGINPNDCRYETTTTNELGKVDSMVNKTLEYYYTIDALNKGGEEL